MAKLKIEYLNKEDLKPYANNAKVHTAEQIEQIKNSIKEFGFNDPIAIWGDNEIVEGHGRLLAVMEMDDIEQVPVIRLDGLSDKQRRAYTIVHNKLTMNTNFDNDVLGVELKDLVEDIDMTDLGFSDFEITLLTEDLTPEPYNEDDIAEYKEHSDDLLQRKRVIITYDNQSEDKLRAFLHLEEISRVVYTIEELTAE